jgi:hypothetical protein
MFHQNIMLFLGVAFSTISSIFQDKICFIIISMTNTKARKQRATAIKKSYVKISSLLGFIVLSTYFHSFSSVVKWSKTMKSI